MRLTPNPGPDASKDQYSSVKSFARKIQVISSVIQGLGNSQSTHLISSAFVEILTHMRYGQLTEHDVERLLSLSRPLSNQDGLEASQL